MKKNMNFEFVLKEFILNQMQTRIIRIIL